MATIGLSFVDWLIIAVYFAFVLGIGFYLKRFTKSRKTSSSPGGRTAPGSPGSPSSPPTSARSSSSG